ncbi:unnamed protein product [Prunus armeniaca]
MEPRRLGNNIYSHLKWTTILLKATKIEVPFLAKSKVSAYDNKTREDGLVRHSSSHDDDNPEGRAKAGPQISHPNDVSLQMEICKALEIPFEIRKKRMYQSIRSLLQNSNKEKVEEESGVESLLLNKDVIIANPKPNQLVLPDMQTLVLLTKYPRRSKRDESMSIKDDSEIVLGGGSYDNFLPNTRFVLELVPIEEEKCKRFEEGLWIEIQAMGLSKRGGFSYGSSGSGSSGGRGSSSRNGRFGPMPNWSQNSNQQSVASIARDSSQRIGLACRNCGQIRHFIRDYLHFDQSGGQSQRTRLGCYACGQVGHNKRNCPSLHPSGPTMQ